MKKLILGLALCMTLSVAATAAFAKDGGFTGATGGFTGPGPSVVTVEQAKAMKDDARVALEGRIIQHFGGDEYLFEDASGTITVDIDDKKWMGQQVGPKDRVLIRGKVDKGWTSTEIEVKQITKK